jgi:type I restriction enzyme S subunit
MLGTSLMKLTCNRDLLDPLYAFYWFRSQEGQAELLKNSSTVGTPGIGQPLATLKRIRIPVPPLTEQRRVAAILGALDDKIDLNRRMSQTLESMARAIFKSWFVDFDPVRAKAECRDPGLPSRLAELFPQSFDDTAETQIPAGWRVVTVADEFLVTMGQSPPGETYNQNGDGLPFYQGRADFGRRFPSRRVYCTAPTRLARPGDALVCVRAPVGDTNVASEDCAIGRGLAAVRHKSGAGSYTLLTMRSLADRFAAFESEGTVFGSINKQGFGAMRVISPPVPVVLAFEQLVSPLDAQVECAHLQAGLLATLRDSLLPRLISGSKAAAA